MAEVSQETAVAGKVFDYAHYQGDSASSDAMRKEVVDQLKIGSGTPGFDEGLNQRLVDSGTLPDLLIKDWGKLDTDNDSKISYNEVLDAARSDDPLVRLLGQSINDNKIPGSIDPVSMYPQMDYALAQKDAFEVPEQRPGGDAPLTPPGADIPAAAAVPPTPEAAAALLDLQNPATSAEAKLKDIAALVKAGQTTATIKDADGSDITVRLAASPISAGNSKDFIHMYAVDPATGKETVMLRGVSDGTNVFKEKDAHGKDVEFVGSKWRQHHPSSMFKV